MRASAMAAAGMVLSQPTTQTTASNNWPRQTSSIESATTSRLTSEAFMPSVPIVSPSLMAMVLNSMGVPPAARMPSFTFADSRRRWKLQGMVSIQVLATPMMGLRRSSSVKPMALNMARDGARSRPSVMPRLRCLGSIGVFDLSSIGVLYLALKVLSQPGNLFRGKLPLGDNVEHSRFLVEHEAVFIFKEAGKTGPADLPAEGCAPKQQSVVVGIQLQRTMERSCLRVGAFRIPFVEPRRQQKQRREDQYSQPVRRHSPDDGNTDPASQENCAEQRHPGIRPADGTHWGIPARQPLCV